MAERVVRRPTPRCWRRSRPPAGRDAWTTFATTEKTWAARQDQLPSTHPIVADAVDMEAVKTNFDGITYAKGASVLKQLVAWVGQEEFLAGLRNYFRRLRVRQHHAARPARRARGGQRPRPQRLGAGVARDHRRQHAAPAVRDRFLRPLHRVRRRPGGRAGAPDAALAPDRDRPLRPHRRTGSSGASGSSSTSPARSPRCPSCSAPASPTCCCSTTTT